MPRFNDAPVKQEHIDKIKTMLADPDVNALWIEFVGFGNSGASAITREKAFQKYAKARDIFLKLPPLEVTGIQGTNSRSRVH